MQYGLVRERTAEVYNAKRTLTRPRILVTWRWINGAQNFAFLAYAFPF
jgi:hypothetical protein